MPKKDKKKRKEKLKHKVVKDPTSLYTICETLGEGSYGKVYRAINKKDGKSYAIKVVHVEDDIQELENEINILKKCSSPYIVNYYDSFLEPSKNNLWIVIEFCQGGSICDILNILKKTLDEKQSASVMKASLQGLAYLHKQRKIHRDVKSGNILLTEKGEVKLTDFGVSVQLTNSISKRKTVIGTPYWMAPEVIQESDYDEKADIWSLGITLLEISEGKPPLSSVHPMRAIFMIPNRPSPTFTKNSHWGKDAKDFLAQCCIKDPNKRPSCRKLLGHPYIRKAKSPKVILQPLIEQMNQKFQEHGGRDKYFDYIKKLQMEKRKKSSSSDSDEDTTTSDSDSDSDSDTSDSDGDGTVMLSNKIKTNSYYSDSEDDDDDSDSDSTMVLHKTTKKKEIIDDSSDTEDSDSDSDSDDDSDSDFDSGTMKMAKKKTIPKPKPKLVVTIKKIHLPKKENLTVEKEVMRLVRLFRDFDLPELIKQKEKTDSEMEKKLISIKESFDKKKEAIQTILNQRKQK